MPRAARRRTIEALALSVGVHVVVLVAVALHAPRLRVPRESAGPPLAVIPVLIVPHTPPPAAGAQAPAPIRLHRRPQRFTTEEAPVAPLVAPEEKPARPAPSPAPKAVTAPPAEDPVAVNARQALRGRLGCAGGNLSPEERRKCEEQLASGARDAPDLGLGLNKDKASDLAAAAAKKETDYNWRRYQNSRPRDAGSRVDWDVNRGPPGQAEAMGARLGSDKPSTVLKRF